MGLVASRQTWILMTSAYCNAQAILPYMLPITFTTPTNSLSDQLLQVFEFLTTFHYEVRTVTSWFYHIRTSKPLTEDSGVVGCHTIWVGKNFLMFWRHYNTSKGHTVAQLVEAQLYKSEDHGFNCGSSGITGIFHWHNPSGRTVALGWTQPLVEVSNRNTSWGVKAAVHKADNLTTSTCQLSSNMTASTSWNPQSLSKPI